MWKDRVADALSRMPPPEEVGESEYRVLYEHILSVISSAGYDGAGQNETVDHVVGSLQVLAEWISTIKCIWQGVTSGEVR